MKIVIDSGIWISAFHFGGLPLRAILKAFQSDQIVYCVQIQAEVEMILTKKFGWRPADALESFEEFARSAIKAKLTGSIAGVCRDPKDDMIFECAVVSGADFILTGDKDLLVVQAFRGVRALTVREYLFAS